jgi:hypothetical protein
MADDVKVGSDGKVYEMQWDCKFCGTKKLLGKTHRFCPNCGGQQDPSWRYFPADSEKVAVQDHVFVGADKVCPACKSLSAASAEFCGNCGSPLDKAAAAQTLGERKTGEGQEFATENLKERQQAAQRPQAQTAPKPKSGGINKLWIILGVIAVVVIGGIIFVATSTKTTTVAVKAFRWEREIRIESLQAIPGKTNCDSVPASAYSINRNYEKVGSHSEQDGETCERKQVDQGDGTFREEQSCSPKYKQVDDYGYMCTYVLNTWAYSRSLTSNGDKTLAVSWPEENISTGSCLGCEREASRNETYYLVFTGDGGKTFECPVPADEWNATKLEQAFNIKIGTVLKDARCDTLEAAK